MLDLPKIYHEPCNQQGSDNTAQQRQAPLHQIKALIALNNSWAPRSMVTAPLIFTVTFLAYVVSKAFELPNRNSAGVVPKINVAMHRAPRQALPVPAANI